MDYLHSKCIVYRDLKLENALLDKSGHIKLIDLGISTVLGNINESMHSIAGTYDYMAPEVQSKTYDFRVDWYSFGIFLFKMYSPTTYWLQVSYIVHREEKLEPKIKNVPARKLIGKVCAPARLRLYEVEKIKRDEYFENIDWRKMDNGNAEPPYRPSSKSDKRLKSR